MKCKKCGATGLKGAFCTKCGAKLSEFGEEENVVSQDAAKKEVKEEVAEAVEEVKEEKSAVASEKKEKKQSDVTVASVSSAVAGAVAATVSSTVSETVSNVKEKKFNAKTIGVLVGCVAVVALILILVLTNRKTLDLNKFVTVEFEGYDGHGTATIKYDTEALEEFCESKVKFKGLSKSDKKQLESLSDGKHIVEYLAVAMNCDAKLDKYTELSNGDKVVLSWDVNEDFFKEYTNLKIKMKDTEYKVKDLEEIDTQDFFNQLEVTYEGTAPLGTVNFKFTGDSEIGSYMQFKPDKYDKLSNGDTVKVKLTLGVSETRFAELFGCLPAKWEEEYVVEGLPSYLSASSEITEDAMAQMKKQVEDTITGSTANYDKKVSISSVEYAGNYFITPKTASGSGFKNKIYMVYKVIATMNLEDMKTNENVAVEKEYYYVVSFTNLMAIPEQGVFVDTTQYRKESGSFTFETDVRDRYSNYSFWFQGTETLEEIYKMAVVNNIESCNYEDNMIK